MSIRWSTGESLLRTVVAKSSVLVSDGAGAYRVFAGRAGIPHVALNLSAGEHAWGIYHIQNVNNYDSLRIPAHVGHLFRRNPANCSDGCRPPLPIEAGHP